MTAFESDNYTNAGVMTSAIVDVSADWIATDGGANDGKTGIDSYGYQTYLHEIGHALGLGHQDPYNGNAVYSTDATYADDTWQYSVMSYFSENNYSGSSYRYVVTPQMSDGLPVLARVNAGTDVARLIEDEKVGRVYLGYSVNELKRLAEEMIDNEAMLKSMSKRGRRLGTSMFSPEIAARQILAVANPETMSDKAEKSPE
jgi:hypothetical protein